MVESSELGIPNSPQLQLQPAATVAVTENPSTTPSSPSFFFSRPSIRLTSEFDSDSSVIFHKISCKLFDSLAKLKLSFQNDTKGQVSDPQVAFVTKHLTVHYDVEDRNAFVKGSFDVGDKLQFRAAQDIKSCQLLEPKYLHVGCSTNYFCISCTCDDSRSIVSCVNLGSLFLFRYQYLKARQGELAMITSLADPSYKLELSSSVPFIGLPRATFKFPVGEISLEEKQEEKEDEEVKRTLSMNGIVKGQLLNGVCTAQYRDEDLNLRYCYKDSEMSFIPSISLPSNVLSFAFKRRFGLSDKLSYWYNFDTTSWSSVYKHTVAKDLKFKAGYDSEVRLGWASLWVGDEDGKAKTAPMKMKVQFMLQVPQDDITSSALMFRVKKRWDI